MADGNATDAIVLGIGDNDDLYETDDWPAYLTWIQKVFASLSIICSYGICREIVTDLRNPIDSRHAPQRGSVSGTRPVVQLQRSIARMLLQLSVSDIIFSFAIFLGEWPAPKDTWYIHHAAGNQQFCTFQGWMRALGYLASPMFSVALNAFYLLLIRYQWQDSALLRLEKKATIAIWTYALVMSIVPIPLESYNSDYDVCWIVPSPLDCSDEDCTRGFAADKLEIFYQFVHIWTCMIVCLVLMIALVFTVKDLEDEAKLNIVDRRGLDPRSLSRSGLSRGMRSSRSRGMHIEGPVEPVLPSTGFRLSGVSAASHPGTNSSGIASSNFKTLEFSSPMMHRTDSADSCSISDDSLEGQEDTKMKLRDESTGRKVKRLVVPNSPIPGGGSDLGDGDSDYDGRSMDFSCVDFSAPLMERTSSASSSSNNDTFDEDDLGDVTTTLRDTSSDYNANSSTKKPKRLLKGLSRRKSSSKKSSNKSNRDREKNKNKSKRPPKPPLAFQLPPIPFAPVSPTSPGSRSMDFACVDFSAPLMRRTSSADENSSNNDDLSDDDLGDVKISLRDDSGGIHQKPPAALKNRLSDAENDSNDFYDNDDNCELGDVKMVLRDDTAENDNSKRSQRSEGTQEIEFYDANANADDTDRDATDKQNNTTESNISEDRPPSDGGGVRCRYERSSIRESVAGVLDSTRLFVKSRISVLFPTLASSSHQKSRAVAYQGILYTLAFMSTHLLDLISSIIWSANEIWYLEFDIVTYMVLQPALGILNFLIFSRNRPTMVTPEGRFLRKIFFCCGCCKCQGSGTSRPSGAGASIESGITDEPITSTAAVASTVDELIESAGSRPSSGVTIVESGDTNEHTNSTAAVSDV